MSLQQENLNQIVYQFSNLYLTHHQPDSVVINQLVKVSDESWVVFLSDFAHNEYVVGWLGVDGDTLDTSDLKYYRFQHDKEIEKSGWSKTHFEFCKNEFLKCFRELC